MWANTRTGARGTMTTMLGNARCVALKDPKQVSADSLQSPHDPDVTYSGGEGSARCRWRSLPRGERHPAHHPRRGDPLSGSDTDVSVPVVDGLAERKVRPDELFVDTAYGSGRNAFEASRRGGTGEPGGGVGAGELARRRA